MTMFGVTQTQRLHAAVGGAGIANYTSFYGETFFTTFTLSLFGGTPYDDPAIYTKLSATTFIKQAKTPTLVLVGNGIRVLPRSRVSNSGAVCAR